MNLSSQSKNLLLFTAVAATVILLSQISGYLVNSHIPQQTSVEINGFLHLTHVRNYGGVFGMFQGRGWQFALFSGLLLTAVVIYLYRAPQLPRYEYLCFGFIVGGGASNVLDRLIYGSVIDFIDLQHIPYWNYVFNTADVMIHVGIWPLLLMSLLNYRQTDKTPP
jgi:signal peptidase II